MPLRVFGLKLPVGAAEEALLPMALKRAGLGRGELARMVVARKSLDRRGGRLLFTYTVDLQLREEEPKARLSPRGKLGRGLSSGKLRFVDAPSLPEEHPGSEPLQHSPLVVGSGPAGLFAALWLARAGYRPRILERGEPMNRRLGRIRDLNTKGLLDPESNYLFGEGGAGTFSDGKLTSRSKDPRAAWVLQEFRRLSGDEELVYHYRPHLGSERIRGVVGRLRGELQALGVQLVFGCRVEGLSVRGGRVVAVATSLGEFPAQTVVLGVGHSARALIRRLFSEGVVMARKPFQLGLRVEHPQDFVNEAVLGELAGQPGLGPADYRLAVRCGNRSVYSFCMCPGGEILPAISDLAHMNTNGMSHSGRSSGFANSGLVTTVEPSAFGGQGPLTGLDLQERLEARASELAGHGVGVPAQRLVDFLAGRPSSSLPPCSCRTGAVPVLLRELLPPDLVRVFPEALGLMERQMPGFIHPRALLAGPEVRSSSPVRMLRNRAELQARGLEGLYPVGEGAGHAGGIISAAADGIRAAQALIRRYGRPSLEPA